MHEIMKAMETPRFDVFIYYMEVMGALEVVLPEVHALVNVPEKIEYHPEGTTFKHVLLTLGCVRDLIEKLNYFSEFNELLYKPLSEREIEVKGELSPKLLSLLNFGLLCHDLGKAKTPEDVIPSHIKHEINGVPIVEELCNRLRFPNKYLEFGTICCKYHMRFYNYLESHKSKHYDLIDSITKFLPENAWKLRLLLFVHWCDVFGREDFPMTERVEYLKEVMKLINLEYGAMLGVTLENLPNSTQNRLNKYSGVKFGKLYRDEMISYFKKVTAS
jgi:tRNA nucleotidyltransferase (CCA-adding enzyme)